MPGAKNFAGCWFIATDEAGGAILIAPSYGPKGVSYLVFVAYINLHAAYILPRNGRVGKKRTFESSSARKARVRGLFVEHVKRDKLYKLHNGLCGICGEPVHALRFEIDHRMPISKGGTHGYENCQPAHSWCNRLKADSMPEDLTDPPGKRKKDTYRNNGLAYRKSKSGQVNSRSSNGNPPLRGT
jgi:hypothetical protein